MKRTIFATGFLCGLALTAFGAGSADQKFEKAAKDYIDGYLADHPERATKLGDHRFDDQLTDYSTPAQQKELARAKRCAAALKEFGNGSKLSSGNRVDLGILVEKVNQEIFELSELKEADWNPMLYSQSFGDSLYPLVTRDFDTPEKRIATLSKRMEAIPRVIEQAKKNLQHPPRTHTAAAIDQVRDSVTLIRLGLDPLLNQAPTQKQEVATLQNATSKAMEDYMKWLGGDLLHRSDGNFRLGQDKFRKKLRFTVGSGLSMEEILKLAKEDLKKTQELMYETAGAFYQDHSPQATSEELADRRKVIKTVLDKLAQQHPEPASIVSELQKAIGEATDFMRHHNLVTVPDSPAEAIIMPEFQRDAGLAFYCDVPGALDQPGKTIVAIAPPPAIWPAPRQASFYREYNNYMLRDLAAREMSIACLVQPTRGNAQQTTTPVRAIFPSDTSTQGWAAYSEQMMADAGFGGPEVKMQQLKMRLRYDCDAILDQSIQAGQMNVQEAMNLMKFEGFQEEGQMVESWKRARLTSARLSIPFVGMIEQLQLLEKAKTKGGASIDVKKYNDQVVSYGSLPVKDVRTLMGL
ncbi:MAG TPA: DUF885 domain-containing protein [Chthoniobacterales bacterium]